MQDEGHTFTFSVDEKLRTLGVDNGDAKFVGAHKTNTVASNKGRALLIVQGKTIQGLASIKVTAGNLQGDSIVLELKN